MMALRSADRQPIVPAGTADDIISMLKNATAQIKTEGFNGNVDFGFQVTIDVHDVDAILPHWKEFIEAIRSSNPDNQFWAFSKMKMPQSMLDIFQPALAARNIHTLEFRNDPLDASTLQTFFYPLVCEVLENNSTIKRLIVKCGARFGARLVLALKNNKSLEELHLPLLNLGDVESMLPHILDACKSLKYLSFRGCTLGREGSTILSTFLKRNPGLESLYLGDVNIMYADAQRLAEALTTNTNLRVLSLVRKRGNVMFQIGRQALCAALFDTKSLDSVANSNHTCSVQIVSCLPDCPYEALLDALNRNSCHKDNRKWKMLSVLYATNGKGISDAFKYYQRLKVIPEILALIAEESTDDSLEGESTEDSNEMLQDVHEDNKSSDAARSHVDASKCKSGSKTSISLEEVKSRREWGAGVDPLKLAGTPWPVFPLNSVQKVLGSLLDEAIKIDKESFGIFSVPVSKEDFPEYYEIVKTPMDYGTMKEKLDKGEYHSVQGMQKDFILVAQNCLQFNATDSDIVREIQQQTLMRPNLLKEATLKNNLFICDDGNVVEVRGDDEGKNEKKGSSEPRIAVKDSPHEFEDAGNDEDGSDEFGGVSVESDASFDDYDSELDELDDAFEEDVDEAFEDFDKSFVDPTFSGERARLTIMYQVLKLWGLHLLDNSTSPIGMVVEVEREEERKPKKRKRKIVVSKREIDMLSK